MTLQELLDKLARTAFEIGGILALSTTPGHADLWFAEFRPGSNKRKLVGRGSTPEAALEALDHEITAWRRRP